MVGICQDVMFFCPIVAKMNQYSVKEFHTFLLKGNLTLCSFFPVLTLYLTLLPSRHTGNEADPERIRHQTSKLSQPHLTLGIDLHQQRVLQQSCCVLSSQKYCG